MKLAVKRTGQMLYNEGMIRRIPKFLQSALWSYDLSKMSLDNLSDRKLIVEQVFNYGTDKQVKWVLANLPKRDFVYVLKNPSRGNWNLESLNYWLTVFGVKLDREKYERAIKNIYPQTQVFANS